MSIMTQTATVSAATAPAPNITIIAPTIKMGSRDDLVLPKRKKVAAYARVSTEQDEQQSSYEAQVDFYTTYIRSNPDWEFVEVYADEGISGTNTKRREGFRRMIDDAMSGKIDLILTKSISRFARNTVDTLSTVRELKNLGIEVIFEKENLHTLDPKCEVMLTIMSSLAQEESRSISENVSWGKRKSMLDGKVEIPYGHFLGYRKGADGKPEIVPEEAKVVRKIFQWFIEGYTINAIVTKLEQKGIKTAAGKTKWYATTVSSILQNEKYKGDAMLQKSFTVDYLSKKRKKNEGEVTKIYVEGSHPAIIEPDLFDLAQYEMVRRSQFRRQVSCKQVLSTRLICGHCGAFYGHKTHHTDTYRYAAWCCNEKSKGRENCDAPNLKQYEVEEAFAEALTIALAQPGWDEVDEAADAAEKARLQEQRNNAEMALNRAVKELRALVQDNTKRSQSQELYQAQHAKLASKVEDHKAALKLAEEEIVRHTARKVKKRIFIKAVSETPDRFYSDALFIKTVDQVVVKGLSDKSYQLTFHFLNGTEATVKRSRE